ncbi:BREX system Lon protease-like protein BrxL [Dehalococcoides mccartyi]|uniref:BREX system Lon protease-like protein BrxL n=1 Tax=Dehalococcoides mccartyi TaxID=61435 RepID=UPI000870E1F3|nr:BREX system Lon protease-like protein BrxL [Dehalococcoides mccartyi]AOV98893.1 ATP-dependent protease [Dehalococcoides mccartyi]
MNSKLREIFRGKIVNKAHTINTGVDEFPRYVLEYLIDNYCSEETFQADMSKVVQRLKSSFVYGAEAEKIRHFIRENRHHSIIANLETRLVETEDKYWATISAINESFVNIPETIVRQYPMLLSGGMWGTIELTYDETEVHNKKIRPFKITEFTPFQVSVINLDEYIDKRHEFTTDEWIDILINSLGLNPQTMNRQQKLLYICRCIPLVETNVNLIELGPRETGKTYLYRNVSYYAHVLSGGKATPSQLFINLNTGKIGEVGTRDAVVLDEIANTDFTDPKSLVSIMQGYMQDARFSRGKKEILAFASLVFVGNLDVQSNLPHEKYYHLFEPLPDYMQVIAFLDRIHAYLPGWLIPKLTPGSYAKDYGFITDYFCEIMHELRKKDLLSDIRSRFELLDLSHSSQGLSGRDQRAIIKTTSGLLKLLYPDGKVKDEELEELLLISCEMRQRVREQLHLMAPGEYERVKLGAKIVASNKTFSPSLPDSERVQRVSLPAKPSVGEVIGLAVEGDHGCILHFEMQATKGSGRIVPLGSIQRVMRESIEAAAQFIRAKHEDLGITAEWRDNFDVAILATYMGIPKEGPSAGIALVTGIVSALKGIPVRNDLAMTGEITIMGKVLPVGGIQQKIRAAYDSGVKEVLLPADNLKEAESLPAYILDKIKITPITEVQEVIKQALVNES